MAPIISSHIHSIRQSWGQSSPYNKILALFAVFGFLFGIAGLYSAVTTDSQNKILTSNITAINLQNSILLNQTKNMSSQVNNLTVQNEDLIEQNSKLKSDISSLNTSLQIEINNSKLQTITNEDANRDKILLAIYEVNSVGLSDDQKNIYFNRQFNLNYTQAVAILNFLQSNNDYELGMNSIFHRAFEPALYQFNLELLKSPNNTDAIIGKIIALNGLGRTNESRSLISFVETKMSDKKFLYKLLGDSYCVDTNYDMCSQYYLSSISLYLNEKPIDISSMYLVIQTCELKAQNLTNNSQIMVFPPKPDGQKLCSINLDTNQTVELWYALHNP